MSRRLYPFLTALPTAALAPCVSGAADAASKQRRSRADPGVAVYDLITQNSEDVRETADLELKKAYDEEAGGAQSRPDVLPVRRHHPPGARTLRRG